jgi:Glyoxalase/Bleomycin resistance protein/Dioxygenase superfamily
VPSQPGAAAALFPGRMFHVGVIVQDLERGMAEWGDSLGVRWREPFSRVAQVHRGGTVADVPVSAVYSVEGPVHIELIPIAPGTVWDVLGVHHVGYWSDDLEVDIQRQVAKGASVEAVFRRGQSTLGAYLGLGSARIELLPVASRPRIVGAP